MAKELTVDEFVFNANFATLRMYMPRITRHIPTVFSSDREYIYLASNDCYFSAKNVKELELALCDASAQFIAAKRWFNDVSRPQLALSNLKKMWLSAVDIELLCMLLWSLTENERRQELFTRPEIFFSGNAKDILEKGGSEEVGSKPGGEMRIAAMSEAAKLPFWVINNLIDKLRNMQKELLDRPSNNPDGPCVFVRNKNGDFWPVDAVFECRNDRETWIELDSWSRDKIP